MAALKFAYPWIKSPFLVSAPMLGAATPALAVKVSKAGAFGFLAGGTDPKKLDQMLLEATRLGKDCTEGNMKGTLETLPIGVGFQLFNSPVLPLVDIIAKHIPAAVWLFAPSSEDDFATWSNEIRRRTNGKTRIWIQVGSVGEAMRSLSLANPDVLVMQGNDAGGHGKRQSASIISLVPEVLDRLRDAGRSDVAVLAAGGIADPRGVAAVITLGASGAVMGTRFLVAEESGIVRGWKRELLHTRDGGVSTLRSTLPDRLKETKGWPLEYDGRVVKNKGHVDEEDGMTDEQNIQRYKEELKLGDDAWGPHGRMVTYAGTGVGLLQKIEPAEDIVREVLSGTRQILNQATDVVAKDPTRPSL